VALLLRKHGVKRIRPLQGGLDAWRKLGYPVENLAANSAAPQEVSADN
jgi:3-mercaptopyruvate sulfurtransferase SseA